MVDFQKIREARKRAKFTQEALANALGVKRSVISKYETGAIVPSVDTLEKISIILGVPVGELMGLEHMGGGFWGKEAEPETVQKIADNIKSHHYPDKIEQSSKFDPITKEDEEILKFGGFSALADFYSLSEENQKAAREDIQGFIEYTLEKYKKKDPSANDDDNKK